MYHSLHPRFGDQYGLLFFMVGTVCNIHHGYTLSNAVQNMSTGLAPENSIGIDLQVHEAGYENYRLPPPSYEQALIEDSKKGELDADLAVAKAFIQLLEWRTPMQPCVRASRDDQTEHEIDRVAQEIIWRLERGIAVVESCPAPANA
ncbi:hypothetical protein B0H14DRAFT_2572802 [Mycena olivaceomarginata]|nr:hypothetical protein B0H14DRAFT_2572802 [Mycena olivaceomarginata]